MKIFWPLFEIVPKRVKWRRWPEAGKGWGVYLPLSEPRRIEPGELE